MLKFKKINKKNNTPFDTSILDGISDPVLIVDEQELVIDYNKAYKRLLEADPSKNSLNALTNNKNIKKTIKQCLTGNPTPPSEVYLPNPIGLFFDVKMWRLPDLNAKSPVWAMIVLSDVTSTRRMEQVRSDFVENVSHELRLRSLLEWKLADRADDRSPVFVSLHIGPGIGPTVCLIHVGASRLRRG